MVHLTGPVEAPITYSRVVFGGPSDFRVLQFDFLAKLKSQRFVELQRVTGAYQGDRGLNRHQLLDAFHLWCAEHNRCDYFLTLDFKLIRMLRSRQSSVRVRVSSSIRASGRNYRITVALAT